MSNRPPPMPHAPPAAPKTSGCARALFILIAGVSLVAALAWVTKDKSDPEEVAETTMETPASRHGITPLVNVSSLAGKDSGEVMQVLGEPTSQQATENGPKSGYKGGSVEIVFIGGKADWITVTPGKDIPFGKDALAHFGIPAAEPTFSNENTIRWEPCGDYASVSLFPKDGHRVDYAHIKVATK